VNCDPNSLAQAARCFQCLLPKTLAEIETYLLCQWSNHLTPGCTVPTPIIVNFAPNSPIDFEGTLDWTITRDPLTNFIVQWGPNPGGPYNDSHSPVVVAANLRQLIITVDAQIEIFAIVTAVDSPGCQATSVESGADFTP